MAVRRGTLTPGEDAALLEGPGHSGAPRLPSSPGGAPQTIPLPLTEFWKAFIAEHGDGELASKGSFLEVGGNVVVAVGLETLLGTGMRISPIPLPVDIVSGGSAGVVYKKVGGFDGFGQGRPDFVRQNVQIPAGKTWRTVAARIYKTSTQSQNTLYGFYVSVGISETSAREQITRGGQVGPSANTAWSNQQISKPWANNGASQEFSYGGWVPIPSLPIDENHSWWTVHISSVPTTANVRFNIDLMVAEEAVQV